MENSKPNQTRTLILIGIVILVIACACTCLVILVSAGVIWAADKSTNPNASSLPTQTVDQQMDEIQEQVSQLRGLQAAAPMTRTLLSPEQLRLNVTRDFLEDYATEEALADAQILSAFGLLERDFDLLAFYLELYSEQIAGYYDNKTKEMFVVQGTGFNGPERLTYAHEYNHVLQDQVYDIQDGLQYSEEDCDDGTERCLGIQALLEGDSSFLELQWFQEYSTASDRSQISKYYADLQSPVYDSAPAFMKEDFLFAYSQGYAFVESLYNQGGWEAVDQAYASPPVSTEQVLHPELYPHETALSVTLPDLSAALGAEYVELDRGVMGEWYTYLILAFGDDPAWRLDTDQAAQAAAGWGGDAYVVYTHETRQDLVMTLISEWDSEADAQEFEQAFLEYARSRFGAEQPGDSSWRSSAGYHRFERIGSKTVWLLTAEASLSDALWEILSKP